MMAPDAAFMRQALELARRGSGTAYPNPMVGAVIVKDGVVLAEGWHERRGGAHAEVNALRRAGAAARGATLYATLEPCDHHGATPPCTEAIIEAGIGRVVFAAADPNPQARNGAERLRRAGIDVTGGVEAEAARSLNAAFFHVHERDTPYVAVKLAVSLDGAIASAPGTRTQLTGMEANHHTHRLRAQHDAIVVGGRTAFTDDPLLTVRGVETPLRPLRVVLDAEAALPASSQLVRTADAAPLLVLCAADANDDRVRSLEDAGVSILRVPRSGRRLDLAACRDALADHGVGTVLVEGGGVLASALLDAGLVDRLYLYVAPRLLGAGAVPGLRVNGRGQWRLSRTDRFGADTLLTLDPQSAAAEAR
jgi:diaminohydroxyphosphoribosylaminopyrimidine deaminase / 5-amino-6-(5-phosphoribosylamino)uracil reductase